MKTWKDLVHKSREMLPGDDGFCRQIMLPIGFDVKDQVVSVNFGLAGNIHGLIVGGPRTGKTNLVDSICNSIYELYSREDVSAYVYDVKCSGDPHGGRYNSIGRSFHCMLFTTNEFECIMCEIAREVSERYRLLQVLNCKNCYEYNKKVGSMFGESMSSEEAFCFRVPAVGDKWCKENMMPARIYVLQDVLDYIRYIPSSAKAAFERNISTILKLARAVDIHLILTGTTVCGLKQDLLDMFSMRVLFSADEATCDSVLGTRIIKPIAHYAYITKFGNRSSYDNAYVCKYEEG